MSFRLEKYFVKPPYVGKQFIRVIHPENAGFRLRQFAGHIAIAAGNLVRFAGCPVGGHWRGVEYDCLQDLARMCVEDMLGEPAAE